MIQFKETNFTYRIILLNLILYCPLTLICTRVRMHARTQAHEKFKNQLQYCSVFKFDSIPIKTIGPKSIILNNKERNKFINFYQIRKVMEPLKKSNQMTNFFLIKVEMDLLT